MASNGHSSWSPPPPKARSMVLMKRNADITHEKFLEHWRTVHADLVKPMGVVDVYTQAFPTAGSSFIEWGENKEPVGFDGLAALDFKDAETMTKARSSPAWTGELRNDGPKFSGDRTINKFLECEAYILKQEPRKQDKVFRQYIFLRRKEGMSQQQFKDYWLLSHGPRILATESIKKILRYEQIYPGPGQTSLPLSADGKADWDGIAVLDYASRQSWQEIAPSEEWQRVVAADNVNFLSEAGRVQAEAYLQIP